MTIAFPHRPGKGGPGSFQMRLESGLKNAGWNVVYPEDNVKPDVVMVVGGTGKLGWLWKQKQKGVPIVYRLDGISWLHRKVKMPWRVALLCEFRNVMLQVIRAFLADRLIYQSQFVYNWWERNGWKTKTRASVIYNGVDLNQFKPVDDEPDEIRLLCVEGTLDYSPYGLELLNRLDKRTKAEGFSLVVYGGFEYPASRAQLSPDVDYRGMVQRQDLPGIFRSAVYLSLDINPACPNTVIEALASGTPVVAYDTGSLSELVDKHSGILAPYGSDPWKIAFPDEDALFTAIMKVREKWKAFSVGARERAESRFSFEHVQEQYMRVINELMGSSKKQKQKQ